PMSVLSLAGIPSHLPKRYAEPNATTMVTSVTHNDSSPVLTTCCMLSPKPSAIMDHCNTCLDANCKPGLNTGPTPTTLRTAMPSKIPNTGPPINGIQRPSAMAHMPTTTASARPYSGEGG